MDNGFTLPADANEFKFWVLFFILALIIIPMQSAAEEYFFRGFLVQTLGSWIGSVQYQH